LFHISLYKTYDDIRKKVKSSVIEKAIAAPIAPYLPTRSNRSVVKRIILAKDIEKVICDLPR